MILNLKLIGGFRHSQSTSQEVFYLICVTHNTHINGKKLQNDDDDDDGDGENHSNRKKGTRKKVRKEGEKRAKAKLDYLRKLCVPFRFLFRSFVHFNFFLLKYYAIKFFASEITDSLRIDDEYRTLTVALISRT